MFSFYLTSLGVIPLFVSRAFVPLFATALVARYGAEWGPIADSVGIVLLAGLPEWTLNDATLGVLGVMAAIEIILAKVPEARQMMVFSDSELKGIAAFLTCFLMVGGDPLDLVRHALDEGISTDFNWGNSIAYTWSFALGWIAWLGAVSRGRIYGFLQEMDEDDSLGLQSLLSWAEDGLGFFGVVFVITLPVIAAGVAGGTLLGLYLLRRYIEAQEEKKKVPCSECGTPNAPCGLQCSQCATPLLEPLRVGVMGIVKEELVVDPAVHRFELLSRKRCSNCGDRLKQKNLEQKCASCDVPAFENSKALDQYLLLLRARLPKTMAISFACSFVPVIGLIPGIVYYRVSLLSSLRAYIPRSTGMLTRWGVGLFNLVLICMQPIPILGALTLPTMCFTNFMVYRGVIVRQSKKL